MRKQWLFLLASLLAAVPVLAQRTTATIRGTVTDPTGAVIAGAKVTVKNEDTGLTRTATTNSAGIYSFADLPVGSYRIEVEHPGFKPAVAQRRRAERRRRPRGRRPARRPASVSEVVNVEVAGGGGADGGRRRLGPRHRRAGPRAAAERPQLHPAHHAHAGRQRARRLNIKDKGLLGGSDLSVSGSAVTSNLWTVDGANNNDVGSNRTILVYPSVDAIEEFKIHAQQLRRRSSAAPAARRSTS